MLDVCSHRGADVGSDHFPVVGKIRLKLKKVKKVQPKRPYLVAKLKNTNVSKSYREELSKRLEVISFNYRGAVEPVLPCHL